MTILVIIGSELYGDAWAVVRDLSASGVVVSMPYAPPVGTVVTVHFQHDRDEVVDEITIRAEVTHHVSFADRTVALRFLEFVDDGAAVAAERLH